MQEEAGRRQLAKIRAHLGQRFLASLPLLHNCWQDFPPLLSSQLSEMFFRLPTFLELPRRNRAILAAATRGCSSTQQGEVFAEVREESVMCG